MNKGVYVVQNGKLKKVIASGYGDGLVKTVNGIEPDQRGDVDLGEIATPTDVEAAKDNAIKTARDLAKVDMEMATEGIRGFMHRGVWASGVEYEKNNLVIYNESVYQAVKDIKDSEKEKEPETEVEDNEDVVEEVEDTEEPAEPTEEPNPVEVNPEDEEFGKMYWRMFAPKTKERPRGTYAEAVNGIVPDETGNIELGQLAMLGDVSDGIDIAVEQSSNYTDEQIELIKQEGIGGEVSEQDLMDGIYDAKDHANVVADRARADANRYTDEEIKKIDLQGLGVPNIIKSVDEPEQPPSPNWDIWVQYEKPEGYMTLGDVPYGARVNMGFVVNGNAYSAILVAKNVYNQNEAIVTFTKSFNLTYNATWVGAVRENVTEEESRKNVSRYSQTSMHQWLNSRNENWFTPLNDYQQTPPTKLAKYSGFLSYFPEAVQKYMKTITLPVTEGYSKVEQIQHSSFNAIAFIPSATEYNIDRYGGVSDNKQHRVFQYFQERENINNFLHTLYTNYAVARSLAVNNSSDYHKYNLTERHSNKDMRKSDVYGQYSLPAVSFSMDTPVYKVENEDYYAIGGTEQYATPVKQMWVNILK